MNTALEECFGFPNFGSVAGDGRVGMIDTRDVAAVAAEIAASPATHAGRTYSPSGPERLSYADAAAVLRRAGQADLLQFSYVRRGEAGDG
jgi:hypothetical protein